MVGCASLLEANVGCKLYVSTKLYRWIQGVVQHALVFVHPFLQLHLSKRNTERVV